MQARRSTEATAMPNRSRASRIFSAAAVILAMGMFSEAAAAPDSVQRGREFARTNCARCHSVERSGESPLKSAPPFRSLHQRYPVEYLEEALAEGMVTGHSEMPEFRLEPDQIADFIDFLKSLED
jgi:cytochrome c